MLSQQPPPSDAEGLEAYFSVHGRPEDILKEYLVLELYRRQGVSSGKAAELHCA
ncbi:MAG: hypothetical protein ACJ8CR_22755 [Roseiflexaceae bacterium]